MGVRAFEAQKGRHMEDEIGPSADEAMGIGKQIYDGALTIRVAAERFGVTYCKARKWLRDYRKAHGLPPRNGGYSGLAARAVDPAGMRDLSEMSKEQLIDELIRARADAERAKKGYLVKGGGAEKEFFSSGERNSK